MRSFDNPLARRRRLPLGVAAMLAITAAAAQTSPGSTGLDTSGNFQSEVRACKEGRTGQDQATCLREARNAQADRKRGRLEVPNADFQANALARCSPLMGDDKAACEARMMGQGEVSGSVAGGGLLREIETVVSAPVAGQATPQPNTAGQMGSPPAAR